MPKVLDDCVKKLKAKGHSQSSAFAICSKQTGFVKAKGGKWVRKGGSGRKKAK